MKKLVLVLGMVALTLGMNAQKLKTTKSFDLSENLSNVKRDYKGTFFVTDSLILNDGSALVIGSEMEFGNSASKMHNDYETIARMAYGSLIPVSTTGLKGMKYTLVSIKVVRMMGKLYTYFFLENANSGYAFKKLIAYESSILNGELINPNALMTRDQAISKLREAKDLLELDMMTQDEYDVIKKEVTLIIKG